MRSIDIVTAHKVEITYPLASVGQRIMAFILDAIIIVVGFSLLSTIFSFIFSGNLYEYFMYIILFPFYMFYTLYSILGLTILSALFYTLPPWLFPLAAFQTVWVRHDQ